MASNYFISLCSTFSKCIYCYKVFLLLLQNPLRRTPMSHEITLMHGSKAVCTIIVTLLLTALVWNEHSVHCYNFDLMCAMHLCNI